MVYFLHIRIFFVFIHLQEQTFLILLFLLAKGCYVVKIKKKGYFCFFFILFCLWLVAGILASHMSGVKAQGNNGVIIVAYVVLAQLIFIEKSLYYAYSRFTYSSKSWCLEQIMVKLFNILVMYNACKLSSSTYKNTCAAQSNLQISHQTPKP